MVEKAKVPFLKPRINKYLITWSIQISPNDLGQISRKSGVLQKGLDYVKAATKQNKIEIYRVAEMDELTRFSGRISDTTAEPAHPHGIAILEAFSIEDARRVVNRLVEGFGFGFGEVSVKNYLEYDIKPLVDVTSGGKP